MLFFNSDQPTANPQSPAVTTPLSTPEAKPSGVEGVSPPRPRPNKPEPKPSDRQPRPHVKPLKG